ncbi:MAG: serine/threonine-protein kinase [Microbacterium gubbeenense]|uniref:serine/threonine-protein kinase n=1 Tax=Microbacterium gubbeenense TaxID=159896 RepID=UPI00040B1FA5|nr:serine/threonine-protein kinase [Microbacterium gubbeenense]
MVRRAPSAPPELPGFTFLQLLGSGGFADVFLYEQKLPRRRVAIKVLLPDRIHASATQFTAEANVMAMLSTHPAIVAVYQAGVADDGRPYLVMEYCPRPNLQVRYRRERFTVEEALHTGIPVAAAVETAHRANVLHRDIKPANILVTEYNRPALTDFGIASSSIDVSESQGVSVPWSPPEAFRDPPTSDARSDVYQLGATVYTLLAGRSPFEIPGGENGTNSLIDRIDGLPLPPLGRRDVPRSLEYVLERAMSKNPADRFPTALSFARALQKVQAELGHQVTQIDILDDGEEDEAEEEDLDSGTTRIRRLRGDTTVSPGGLTVPSAPVLAEPFAIPTDETAIDHEAFAPRTDTGADTFAPPAGFLADEADADTAPPCAYGSGGDTAMPDDTVLRDAPAARAQPAVAAPADDERFTDGPDTDPLEDETKLRDAPADPVDDETIVREERPRSAPVDYSFDSRVEFRRGTVPTSDTSTFRVASRRLPPDSEPLAITRTSMAVIAQERRSRRRLVIGWIIAGIAVLAGLIAVAVYLVTTQQQTTDPGERSDRSVPAVSGLSGSTTADEATFRWENPGPEIGDVYRWGIYDEERVTSLESSTGDQTVTFEKQDGEQTCIEVLIERTDGARSATEVACVDN